MEQTFAAALDELITKHKGLGADLGEMAADMRGAADGLDAEEKDED